MALLGRKYSMFSIQKCKRWNEESYNKLLENPSNPFVYYNVLNSCCNPFSSIKFFIAKKIINTVTWFIVYYESDPVMVVPVRLFYKNKTAYVLGSLEGFDYVDIIYKQGLSHSERIEAFTIVMKALTDNDYKVLYWKYLDAKSESNIIISETCDYSAQYVKNVCVKLKDYDSYDNYLKTLSKHVRQNIRTAYNRTKKDSLLIDKNIYNSKQQLLSNKTIDLILSKYYEIYKDRHSSHYHNKRRFQKWINYAWRALDENNAFMADITFNGEISAFMFGFIDDESVYITRLAINEKYKFYSPGMILVNEIIKYLIDEKKNNLNLLRGTEKYKLDFGGEIYNTINYTINLK